MSNMIPEQYRERVGKEVMKSATPSNLKQAIKEKKSELRTLKLKTAYLKAKGKATRATGRIASGISSLVTGNRKNKQVMKGNGRVAVDVSQPVYEEDRSRFFKAAWKEDKKQLYFD